jgi:hypothetical protein
MELGHDRKGESNDRDRTEEIIFMEGLHVQGQVSTRSDEDRDRDSPLSR